MGGVTAPGAPGRTPEGRKMPIGGEAVPGSPGRPGESPAGGSVPIGGVTPLEGGRNRAWQSGQHSAWGQDRDRRNRPSEIRKQPSDRRLYQAWRLDVVGKLEVAFLVLCVDQAIRPAIEINEAADIQSAAVAIPLVTGWMPRPAA